MKKIAIIANSKCGRGDGHSLLQQARRSLWGWSIELHAPSSQADLHKLCETLHPDTHDGVIVIGGDGTFHQTLKAIRKAGVKNLPLCPYPAGTANDLATELKIRPDWEMIQSLLDERSVEAIDCLTVNGAPFATIAGLGIGAKLTSEFNAKRNDSSVFRAMTHTLRSHLYSALSARMLLFSQDYFHRLHFRGEGFDEKLKTPAVFICNQAQLGARMTVAPAAKNNDGRFHVVIVPRIRKHRLLLGMLALHSGILPQDFIVFSTRELTVRDMDGRSIEVFGDGETILSSPNLRFGTDSQSLLVYSGRIAAQSQPALPTATSPDIKVPKEALV